MSRTFEVVEARVSERTRWHFVVLHDGALSAVGECSDAGQTAALIAELKSVAPLLSASYLVAAQRDILDGLAERVARAPRDRAFLAATVMGGVEQMLVDLAAKSAGVPAWKWLGASAPAPVPLYANINRRPGGRAPEDVAADARRAVRAGFRAVKCAPFDVPLPGEDLSAAGVSRLRAVRAAIGDDIALKVDCHARLGPEQLDRVLPDLSDLGIDWLEDAVEANELERLQTLRAATGLRLAGGEHVFSPTELAPVISQGLLDVLMPDVKHAGGMQRVVQIAGLAPNLAVSPHNPAGPVATAASAHAFAACPNATELEYQFDETPWRAALVANQESISGGFLFLSERPGLGVTFQADSRNSRVLWSTAI